MPGERKLSAVGGSADNIPARSETLSQAELISQSLKDVSRQIRRPRRLFWTSAVTRSLEQRKSLFGVWIAVAFVAFVLLPVAASGLYLALFASDQYASEVRFAVRGGERAALDPIASLTGTASTVRIQDSIIVADYIRGRGMVEELEKSLPLREMFSRANSDFVFGFDPAKPVEKLVRYWWWQVDVDIDRMSGIISVVVRAFSPQDSLAIAKALIASSEKLVNDLSDRSRRDALKQAHAELALAESSLQDKSRTMRELRNREGILDAGKTSDTLTKLLGDMRLELARLESEYSTQKQSVSEASPQLRVLEARIRSTRDQIRLVETRMTGAHPPAGASAGTAAPSADAGLATSMSQFDRMRLEQDFAQRKYVETAAALERARMEVETQQVYLATFLQPVLAQEALYPKRWWIMAALTALFLVLWGAGTGIAVLVRNHAA